MRTAGSAKEMSADLSVSLRLTVPLGGEPFRRQKGAPMRFIYCLCYAAGLGVVSFVLGRLVPKEWFDYKIGRAHV